MTLTPPASQTELELLRVLLNDVNEPYKFDDAALYFILSIAPDMATAVKIGWQWTIVKTADPNRLVRGQIGNESMEFPSLGDLSDWLDKLGDWFDGIRDRERGMGEPVMLLRSVQAPCFYGVSGPYTCEQAAGYGNNCYDASRFSLHGVTGAGAAQ
jgi:hypothetical protein